MQSIVCDHDNFLLHLHLASLALAIIIIIIIIIIITEQAALLVCSDLYDLYTIIIVIEVQF